jgi:hypothetical protein
MSTDPNMDYKNFLKIKITRLLLNNDIDMNQLHIVENTVENFIKVNTATEFTKKLSIASAHFKTIVKSNQEAEHRIEHMRNIRKFFSDRNMACHLSDVKKMIDIWTAE